MELTLGAWSPHGLASCLLPSPQGGFLIFHFLTFDTLGPIQTAFPNTCFATLTALIPGLQMGPNVRVEWESYIPPLLSAPGGRMITGFSCQSHTSWALQTGQSSHPTLELQHIAPRICGNLSPIPDPSVSWYGDRLGSLQLSIHGM